MRFLGVDFEELGILIVLKIDKFHVCFPSERSFICILYSIFPKFTKSLEIRVLGYHFFSSFSTPLLPTGTDGIFQQILSISAAKQGDGWIKELCSVNDIFQILFGIQLHRDVFGTICSILFPEKISTQLNEATDRLGPCCKMVFTSILLYVQLGFCRTTKQNHWKVI